MKTRAEWIAAGLLVALWLVCAWRAATQSIVHDEALTYQLYLAGPAGEIFHHFDANNHFLNTLLMRVSTSIGGFSPFTMRLPALLGAGLFFTALFRFCRWAFGSGWLLPVAVAAVSLNPLLLDFMVAARGYGLALALWMWALAVLAPQLDAPVHDRKSVAIAGACAALSVTANLIFVLPVSILAVVVLWLSVRRPRNTPKTARKHARNDRKTPPLWRDFLAPAAAVSVAFLLLAPLESAAGADFYVGASSIGESLKSLGESSLIHSGPSSYQSLMSRIHGDWLPILAVIVVAWGAVAAIRTGSLRLILTAVPACGSALLILLLHFAVNLPYPVDRTGIYFIPAATLTLLAVAMIDPVVFSSSITMAIILIACYAIQFDTRRFSVWSYDADTNRIAERLSQIAEAQIAAENAPTKPVTIVNSWQLEPALNFYRETRHYDQLPPFTRRAIGPGFDVYVLTQQDRAQVENLGLTIIYTGSISQTVIATSAGPPASH